MKTLRCGMLSFAFLLCLGPSVFAQSRPAPSADGASEEVAWAHPPKAQDNLPQPGRLTSYGWMEITGPKLEGVSSSTSSLPPTVPAGRPVIGVVLEGGGALGLAHIGVLEWLEENHIPVDRIAGTSMGALVGGIYATGRTAKEVEHLATESDFGKIFTFETPYTDLSYRRRQDRRELPQGIQFGLRNGVSLRNALLSDRGLDGFLHANLSGYNTEILDYNRLPTPFRCVATDLNDLSMVVFAGGPLNVAVRASISIPGIFSPVEYHHHYLVDGSIMDNLPTDVAKAELKPDVVIAVHLSSAAFAASDVDSIVGVFARAFSAGTARNERLSRTFATLVLDLKTDQFSTTDYGKAHDLIEVGYKAAAERRAELLKYALNDADWAAYLADRSSRKLPAPGLLETLTVKGGSAGAQAKVERDLAPLRGQPIDQDKIFTALGKVQGNGSYLAGFETFSPDAGPNPNNMASYEPDTGVLVRLRQVRNGPPFMILGGDVSAMNSNVTRGAFDARFIDQNFGGYGSELRGDLRLGFLTQATAEYYRLLTQHGIFLQPHIGIIREPVYLWTNQVRTSELLEQQAGGGLDLGRTFNRNMQLAAEWRDQLVRWHLVLGHDIEPDLSGTSQTGVIHFVYDNTQSGTVSPRGIFLDLSGGALFHSLNNQTAPLFHVAMTKSTTVLGKNIFQFSGEGNTYFRRDVADPLRFTLGGPLRLSASSIDEYRGTDDYLARGVYLRQLAPLPSGLGQGLYFTFGYEAGEMWSPEKPAFLREDGFTGLVAATPFGVITFGTGVGDAGHRKVFFTVGRLF